MAKWSGYNRSLSRRATVCVNKGSYKVGLIGMEKAQYRFLETRHSTGLCMCELALSTILHDVTLQKILIQVVLA